MAWRLRIVRPVRIAIVVVPLVAALHSRADACPEDRDGPDCTLAWQKMSFDHLTHIVALSYPTLLGD